MVESVAVEIKNVDKCKVLSIGLRITDFTYYLGDVIDRIEPERTFSMKDLGVIIDCKLKFKDHIKQKINKAYSMLGTAFLEEISKKWM